MRVLTWNLGWGLVGLLALTLASCAADVPQSAEPDGEFDNFFANGAADAWGVSEGSDEAIGVLRVVNELSQAELDRVIDRRAAQNIIAYRAGADGQLGTADDRQVASLEALDAISWVGPVAFGQLLREADRRGWIGGGGGVVVDPTGDGGLGTIIVTFPTAPAGFERASADELGNVYLYQEDLSRQANVAASVIEQDSWSLSAVPGTYCIGIRPAGAVGNTYRCGVTVTAGQSTTVRASLVWVGELDVMDVIAGNALNFIVRQDCAGANCQGQVGFNASARGRWHNRYQPLLSGDYTIEYSVPNIAAVQKKLASGVTESDSFLPETDHRAYIYPSADAEDGQTPTDCTAGARGHLYATNFEGRNLKWSKSISLSRAASGRIADPIYYFPQEGGEVRIQYGTTFGNPHRVVELGGGESEFFRIRRAVINDVKVTVSTPNGPVEEQVTGSVSLVFGNTFGDSENAYVCRQNRAFPTPRGVDLLPGMYNANVTYNTSAGSGSKDYAIDAR